MVWKGTNQSNWLADFWMLSGNWMDPEGVLREFTKRKIEKPSPKLIAR